MYNTPSQPFRVHGGRFSFSTSRIRDLKNYPYFEGSSSQSTDKAFIMTCVLDALSRNSKVSVVDWKEAYAHGYSFGAVSGQTEPPQRTYTHRVKVGTPHVNFEQRKATGEIMVSDYRRCEITVRLKPGLKFSTVSSAGNAPLTWRCLTRLGYCTFHKHSSSPYVLFTNGIVVFANSEDNVCCEYPRSRKSDPSWVFPYLVNPEDIASTLLDLKPDPTELVTKVTARANRASLDVLTAMAEMPKALSSVYAGLKQLAYLATDVKKGEFIVKNKFKARKRDLNLKYSRDVKRLKKGLSDPTLSPARKRKLLHRLRELEKSHSRSLLSHADELTSALADVWLNFRYNIMPNVYVIQDTVEAIERYKNEYTTNRGFTVDRYGITVPYYNDFFVDLKTSCMIRRNFSADRAASGASVISNDIFVTAWELVPLSFVYDWFINIGDRLSSMSYNAQWAQEGATLASSVEGISQTLVPLTPYVDFDREPSTEIVGFVYDRRVIDPTSLCGLVWKPSVGLERQIDAAALAWRPVRSFIINLKGRNK